MQTRPSSDDSMTPASALGRLVVSEGLPVLVVLISVVVLIGDITGSF